MKKLILNIFTRILWIRARQSIQQNNPKIIGITGSVGKTTTRDFLSTILSSQYTIQAAKRSFNTPIGIAFTILGIEKSPYSNPFRWIHLIVSVFISPLPKFDILILEMGADTPGDISDLLSCVSIDYAIITHITENHIAEWQFSSYQQIFTEKTKLITETHAQKVWLDADSKNTEIFEDDSRVVLYKKDDINSISSDMNGLSFSYQGSVYNFPKIYGEFLAPLCFVCVLCSQEFGIPEDKIQSSIRSIQFPAGRGTLLKGKNQSIIIDSSYNANPDTFIALINEVNRWKYEKGPRIIVLGSMNELGKNNTTAHQTVAQQAAHKFDHYICIGHGATIYKKTLMHQGINESQIEVFHSSKDAGNIWIEKCKDMNYTNALFVVKGSQNQVWTERFIPPLLQNKEDISLLARDIPNT